MFFVAITQWSHKGSLQAVHLLATETLDNVVGLQSLRLAQA